MSQEGQICPKLETLHAQRSAQAEMLAQVAAEPLIAGQVAVGVGFWVPGLMWMAPSMLVGVRGQ